MGKQDDKDESKRLEQNSFNMADQQRVRKKAAREKEEQERRKRGNMTTRMKNEERAAKVMKPKEKGKQNKDGKKDNTK